MDRAKLRLLFVSPATTIKQAMHRLNETSEKILFVVDVEDRLLGTVTDGDIRRGIIGELEFTDPIEKVMRRECVSLPASTVNIEATARQRMLATNIEQIPVLDDRGAIIDVILWTSMLEEKGRPRSRRVHSNQVVIMAGGKGTRLDPFTRILPKPLIPIGDKAVIELIMEKFHQVGFHRFVYTLKYKKEYIKTFLRENQYPYEIEWVEEADYLGTAGSLALLQDRLTGSFFITNCDSLLLDVNFEDILNWHHEQGAAITIVGCHNEFRIPFGVLELSDGKLKRLTEKPVQDVIINTGVYVMESRVLGLLEKGRRIDMNEVIDRVAQQDTVSVYPIYGNWLDIGQWEEYRKTLDRLKAAADNT